MKSYGKIMLFIQTVKINIYYNFSLLFSYKVLSIKFYQILIVFLTPIPELSQSPIPKHQKIPVLVKSVCAAGKILKKTGQRGVFRHFLENFYQKIAFFWHALSPPLKLVYIGAQGAFRKHLGSVCQTWISQNISKGGACWSAAEGKETSAPAPAPLNPPLILYYKPFFVPEMKKMLYRYMKLYDKFFLVKNF